MSLEADPVAAVLDAVKSLAIRPYSARLICSSSVMQSICAVTTCEDGRVQKAAVELLILLLQGELKQDKLWDLMSEGSLLGLFNMLKMGNTENETLVLNLLMGHPDLVKTNVIGHSQLAAIESILQYGSCTCQNHAMALLMKLVQEGLEAEYFVSKGVNIVCTLIGLTIGDNQHIKNLALETLKLLVERESGVEVAEMVIQHDGIGVIKYLVQENSVESRVPMGPILSLLWAVSRVPGGNSLVRSEGIVMLLVENLMDPKHTLDTLDCLHHFLVEDPENIADIAATCTGAQELLLGIFNVLTTMDHAVLQEAKSHPLEVLALLLSSEGGCKPVSGKANEWVHALMSFTGPDNDTVKGLALECMKGITDIDTPLRLALEEPSLRFVASLLTRKHEDLPFGLHILAGLVDCSSSASLQQSGVFAGLCELVNDAAHTEDIDLRLMLLNAMAQVGILDGCAFAREIIRQDVQNMLWALAVDCFEALSGCHVIAICSLLKVVREKEIQCAKNNSNDLHYLSLEHRLQQKDNRIALLQSKVDEQFETIQQHKLKSRQADQLLAEKTELYQVNARQQQYKLVACLLLSLCMRLCLMNIMQWGMLFSGHKID